MNPTLPDTSIRLGRGAVLHLAQDLSARALQVDAAYWEHTDRHAELADGRILSVFDYDSTWTWWERHPVGDELAYLISGNAELLLENSRGHASIPLASGAAAIIPESAWHTVRIHEPSTILFVTPTPARTEDRPA